MTEQMRTPQTELVVQSSSVGGRPSGYSDEVAAVICDRLADGESLRSICLTPEMPARRTVFEWLADPDRSGFRTRYALAREAAGDLLAEDIVAIADEATDKDNAAAVKVRVEARMWYASKLRPKVYGNIAAIQHSGPDGGPIQVIIQGDDARL